MSPVSRIIILGGGTAGLLAALTLKRRLPGLTIRVVRSPEIGVIGVGEGTNITFPQHLIDYLGVSMERFHELVEPTWKLGVRFLWGPAPEFFYPFGVEHSTRWPGLARANAHYVDADTRWTGPVSALMAAGKAFERDQSGRPVLHKAFAWHFENRRIVAGLEVLCREAGVAVTDGTMRAAETGPEGIAAIHLEDGERLTADLFIDASGFRSVLLGEAMGVPFRSFSGSLFCDRAVIGGWERSAEPTLPYTTAETMDAGWCWQIEHEHFINRGYVYASDTLSDDEARAEFLRGNPRVNPDATRVVRFRSGRRERLWEGNVVGLGNAGGFVEPLEATAIQVICLQSWTLAGALAESGGHVSPPLRTLYNRYNTALWDDIRDFLAVHYRFNTRRDTPFWRRCRAETDLAGAADIAAFWQEHGASALAHGVFIPASSTFGLEGYFALLAGQRVPVARPLPVPPAERAAWQRAMAGFGSRAARGVTIEEAFRCFRSPVGNPP